MILSLLGIVRRDSRLQECQNEQKQDYECCENVADFLTHDNSHLCEKTTETLARERQDSRRCDYEDSEP